VSANEEKDLHSHLPQGSEVYKVNVSIVYTQKTTDDWLHMSSQKVTIKTFSVPLPSDQECGNECFWGIFNMIPQRLKKVGIDPVRIVTIDVFYTYLWENGILRFTPRK